MPQSGQNVLFLDHNEVPLQSNERLSMKFAVDENSIYTTPWKNVLFSATVSTGRALAVAKSFCSIFNEWT